MTDQTINRLSWALVIFIALVIGAILYMTYYNPPDLPPIDPRTISLKEVAEDSLNAAQTVKITHDETVKMAESVNSQKVKVLNRWAKTKEVRRSLSDSLQGVVLIDRLNK
tara:strand:+ start:630 stop:959 length:330 start_codon:yes stop_codon:yes gene_type:complete